MKDQKLSVAAADAKATPEKKSITLDIVPTVISVMSVGVLIGNYVPNPAKTKGHRGMHAAITAGSFLLGGIATHYAMKGAGWAARKMFPEKKAAPIDGAQLGNVIQ